MMPLTKYILIAAAILVGAAVAADAQGQYAPPPQIPSYPYYRAYQPYPYNWAPVAPGYYGGQIFVPSRNAAPPSWNYDPYTNGLAPQKAIPAG
jgi:hypothetical protein